MIPIKRINAILLSAISVVLVSGPASALAQSDLPVNDACPGPNIAPQLKNPPNREGAFIDLKAHSFFASPNEQAEAEGDVELQRADQLLKTDLLQYNPVTETITMPGQVYYQDAQINISGSNAQYSFLDENGHFSKINYGLTGSSAKGTAENIQVTSKDQSLLRMMQFTTCPGGAPAWMLTAKELNLNFETGVGTAKGAKLEFFDVPILYLPWMTFPITDKRKSGFLYPSMSTANDNGFEFSVPYYWNIAPNQDATLTPRYFTELGTMLTGNYRFITHKTGGEVDFDYMRDDKKTDDTRYHYRAAYDARITDRWASRIVVDRVSDTDYFQDFGNSLAETSRQYLRSYAGVSGSGRYWTMAFMADDFQVVDEAVNPINEPYRRVPRITFDLDRPLGKEGLRLQLDSELVYFDRDVGVTGSRFDLYPRLEWNIETYWGFIRPSAGYRYTLYDLDRNGLPGATQPDRGTSIVSLDSGLFMERIAKNGNIQTLEPRLFYLNVPYVDQSDLPDFDTAPYTFGFSQLFNTNRFTGADRQSDANQLTMAVTTRSINQNLGRELWSLSFGQIVYFDEQRVQAEYEPALSKNESPFIGEWILRPTSRLSARVSAQWNWNTSEIGVATLGVTNTWKNGTRFGAQYLYRRDSVNQFDIRYFQPINESWRVLGNVNYSLEDSDLLAAQAGFEYDSCCWSLRVVGKRFLRNRDGDHRDAIYIELLLKGLTNLGRRASPLFYDSTY